MDEANSIPVGTLKVKSSQHKGEVLNVPTNETLTYIVPGGECAKYGERYGARTHKLLKNDPSHLTCTVDVPCHAQHHRSLGKNSLPCYLL